MIIIIIKGHCIYIYILLMMMMMMMMYIFMYSNRTAISESLG